MRCRWNAISTLIGSMLIHIMIGLNYTLTNLNPYLMSYFHDKNNNLTQSDGYFLYSFITAFIGLASIFKSIIEKKLGIRLTIFISFLCILGGYIQFYFANIFYLVFISYGLIGLGIGFGYSISLNNCINYFQSKVNFITGIIISSSALSPIFINLTLNLRVNPNNIPPENTFYNKIEYERISNYFLIMIILVCILGILGTALIIPFKQDLKDESVSSIRKSFHDKLNSKLTNEIIKDPYIDEYEVQLEDGSSLLNTSLDNEPLSKAALSKDFVFILIVCFLMTFFLNFLGNSLKVFGSLMKISEVVLDRSVIIIPFFFCFSRLIIWFLSDYMKFRIMFSIILIIECIVAIAFYFGSDSTASFYFLVILYSLCFGGLYSRLLNFISFKYGEKNYSLIFGFMNFSISLSNLVGTLIFQRLSIDLSVKTAYLISFLLGAGFTIFAIALIFFVDHRKFKY